MGDIVHHHAPLFELFVGGATSTMALVVRDTAAVGGSRGAASRPSAALADADATVDVIRA